MQNRKFHLSLVSCLAILLASCSKPVTDDQGRRVPAPGHIARLSEKSAQLCTSESAIAELMAIPPNVIPPKYDDPPVRIAQWQQMMDATFENNMARLKVKGKVIQLTPGSKVRILGYYNGDAKNIRPLLPGEQMAFWVKVLVLEGEASQKTGFTPAGGVTE